MMLSADEVTQIHSLVEKTDAAQGDYYSTGLSGRTELRKQHLNNK
jgi:hypothetical protein